MRNIHCIVLLGLIAMGCSSPNATNKNYSTQSLRSASRTVEAKIVSKRAVTVAGNSDIGGLAGTALGATAGSAIGGGGRANLAGAIVGAVAGGLAGSAIEKNVTEQNAFEYIVKLNNGELLTIIQSDAEFMLDEPVFVVLGDKPVLVKRAR